MLATALEEEIGMQVSGVWTNNLRFTDYYYTTTALLAKSPNELQAIVNRVVEVNENLGMKVNIEKTEIQHMGRIYKNFNIVIKKS